MRLRELDLGLQSRLAEQRREFEALRQPMWDQVQRAQRENEALQRELDRQQDNTRKMLAQFQRMIA